MPQPQPQQPQQSTYRNLGRIGYEAYGDVADWKNYEGKRMPSWDELPEDIRVKWTAAAKAIQTASIVVG